MRGRFALLGIWLVLGGCTYLAQPLSSIGQESALEYFERVSVTSDEELQAELNSLQSLPDTQSPVILATKIALLTELREDASPEEQAYALVRLAILDADMLMSAAERDYFQLGRLVRDLLINNQDLLIHRQELLVQRQELREAEEVERELQREIDYRDTEIRLLHSQIEALKNIETHINQRQQENGNGADSN